MSGAMNGDATKRLMIQSLKKMMAQKPLQKISIREIAEDSGVNRQTFYYHFQDIYDMVRWMYQEEAIELLKRHDGVLLWQDGLLQLLRYVEENKAVCLSALNSLGRQYLKRFFYDDVHAIIGRTVCSLSEWVPRASPKFQKFLTHYYVVAMAGMIESWLLGDIEQTPEELILFMDVVLNDHIRGAKMRNGILEPVSKDINAEIFQILDQ